MTTSQTETFFRRLFWITVIAMAIAMPIMSQGFGITWDEWVHSYFGKLIVRYFLTGGQDKSCLTSGGDIEGNLTLNLYGHLFDTLSTVIFGLRIGSIKNAAFQDLHWEHFYETRHAVNALVGLLAMVFTGLLAREIAGYRAAFFALLLIFLSPQFFAHSMNNPKDIPFAATYMMAVYFLVCFVKEYPKLSKRTMWLLALSIALSINVRIGGIVLIAYLVLFAGILYLINLRQKEKNINLKTLLQRVAIISIAGYFGGLIFWPYGHTNPFVNPWIAFKEMSNYNVLILPVLFEGKIIPSDKLPWYYIPKWILITTPVVVLLGWLIFFRYLPRLRRSFRVGPLFVTLFAAIFPVVYTMIKKNPLYDGWRHLLFVYPPLLAAAAIGWDFLFRNFQKRWHNICGSVILFGLMVCPAYWMVQNHPNENVYFNPLVGGLDGAFGNYELDYWGNSLREAAEWLSDYVKKKGIKRQIVVSADGSPSQVAYYLKAKLGDQYLIYKKSFGRDGWDFGIGLTRQWKKADLLSEAFPPAGTIYEVKSGNAILAIVAQNPNRTIS